MITCLRTIKIQLQAETSTGFCFLHMCDEFSQKMTKLVLIWRETSESASFSVSFDQTKISVPLRGRKKETKSITSTAPDHCQGTMAVWIKIQPCGVDPAVAVIHHTSYSQKNARG